VVRTTGKRNSAAFSALGLLAFIGLCFGAAAIGSAFNVPALSEWYPGLQKPFFNPPNWLFGPVWSVLYLAMAVAGWLVWREEGLSGATTALTVFGAQLVLNTLWSGLFFGLRSPGLALVEIVILWVAILATILLFRPVSRVAALLLVPYLAWVSFATVLNFEIWRLNA
jgi:tryptophan-rich sensory protein